MNDLRFRTEGDWPSTTLYSGSEEVAAVQLYLRLEAGREENGEPAAGGILLGGQLSAFVRPAEAPEETIDVFPGRLELQFPGHTILVENLHPNADFLHTRVWYNRREVTRNVLEVFVDINAAEDSVRAFVTLYRARWWTTDEVATYTIF
jgi:hypothetical protein